MRMQRLIKPFVTLAMVWTFLAFGLVPAYGQDTKEPKCTGKYKGGEIPTKEDLAKILQAHEEWVDSRGAKGKKADLCEANLRGANLEKAFLNGANLQEASLFQANLQQADLRGANLQKAVLDWAHLEKADLRGANLQQADLRGAHLQEADLFQANLQQAFLRGANLQKAVLNGAHLQEADLFQANLQQAYLRGANLQKAVLAGANLTDVKNLTQAQLNQACVDENTKLPKGLTRPKPCSEEELGPKRTLGLSSTFLWCE